MSTITTIVGSAGPETQSGLRGTDPALPSPLAFRAQNLRIAYGRGSTRTEVVHDVSLSLEPGKTLALVGQSGSGKSTIALAVAGLLPAAGAVTAGSVEVAGQEVTALSRAQWRKLRGTSVGFIPQDPLSSFDPLQSIGHALSRALLLHTDATRATVAERAAALLERVGIQDAASRLSAYPHELSGGQLQRVLIAIAISGNPRLLIADEPTSALDVTVQKTILDLLGSLQRELGLAILFITHDLALATERSESIAVLTEGQLVEYGDSAQVRNSPSHEYTRRLFADAPGLSPQRYDAARAALALRDQAPAPAAITVRDLQKRYGPEGTPASVRGVSFSVASGEIHALVGESGSGKTTIARIIAGLTEATAGSVEYGRSTEPGAPQRGSRHLQLVYQNPLAALDPRFSVEATLGEPLAVAGVSSPKEREARILEALDQVSLSASLRDRRPRELSGGQRQRVAVARALISRPAILVLDEPTSALDVTVQARIVDLLVDLRAELGLTYLFISHDLSLVRQIADTVSVLEKGLLVESGPTLELFAAPKTEYTRRLLEAIPGVRGARRAAEREQHTPTAAATTAQNTGRNR